MSGGNSVYVSVWWLQVRNSLALFPELPLQKKKKREPGNIIYDVSNVTVGHPGVQNNRGTSFPVPLPAFGDWKVCETKYKFTTTLLEHFY